MESKKNISQLFRDSLEQLDRAPSAKVWEQIESDLDKKKKKRRFFIWFFFISVLIISSLGGFWWHAVSDGSGGNPKEPMAMPVAGHDPGKGKEVANDKPNQTSDAISQGNRVIEDPAQKAFPNSQRIAKRKAKSTQKPTARPFRSKTSQTGLAVFARKNMPGDARNQTFVSKAPTDQTAARLPQNGEKTNLPGVNPQPTPSLAEGKTLLDTLVSKQADFNKNQKSRKEKDSLSVKDSTVVTRQDKKNEIIIAPYYGINYGGHFGEFDALSNNHILEKKVGARDAYGILGRWMLDNRLGVQIGIGKINSRFFSTVEKTDYSFINTQNVATDIPVDQLEGIFANETKVTFTYESSYLEVPIEAYYVLRDKKIGLAAAFGVSVLFGNKNSVFAESEQVAKMKIGTVKTNAETDFTGNLKACLFYKISGSLQLDLYPTFQYQFIGNTNSSGYSNYYFSVRTGISYKF